MAFVLKPGQGTMFKNRDKDESDPKTKTFADMQGEGIVECPNCKEHIGVYVNGWIKTSEKAGKWISLSFRNKNNKKFGEPEKNLDKKGDIPF